MQVADTDLQLPQIVRQLLGHALGEGGDQDAAAGCRHLADLTHQIIHLACGGAYDDLRIQQAGGADDLLHGLLGQTGLVGAGGGGYKDRLMDALFEFLKQQGPVVIGRGQAEAVLYQHVLAGTVAVVHGPDLGYRHMALVNEAQKILRKVVQQGVRRVAGFAAVKVTAVVLNALAVADLPDHLDVIIGALGDAFCFQGLMIVREPLHPLPKIMLDHRQILLQVGVVGRVVGGGKDGYMGQGGQHMAADGIDLTDAVDFVAEELDAQGVLLLAGGDDLHHIAPHPEGTTVELDVVAFILDIDQVPQQLFPVDLHAGPQRDHLSFVL